MNLSRLISTSFDAAKRRLAKVLVNGLKDVRTGPESAPYGTDSNPIADMEAVYADTGARGRQVIVGYINKNQLAAVGEHRIYSTDSEGELKTYIWLHSNGTMDLAGNSDNAVRYSKLAEVVTELQTDINNLKTIFKTAWVVLPGDGGAALKAASSVWSSTNLSKDITLAKINEIKTP